MANFDNVKSIGKSLFEKGKEIGGKAIEKGGQALTEAKINAEIASINNAIRQSKIKLGDMLYQIEVETGIKEIEELKTQIKSSLEEIKYLESKKSK